MAWTTPRTYVAAETVTAAILNTDVRDNLRAIGDAWTAYVPTITNVATSGVVARYRSVGKTVDVRVLFNITGAPSGTITVTLPVTASSAFGTGGFIHIGTVMGLRTAVSNNLGVVSLASTTTMTFLSSGGTTAWNATVPVTWANGDDFHLTATYEAA
jgi:hypothetical protein